MGLGASWMFLCVGSRSNVIVPFYVTLLFQSMNFHPPHYSPLSFLRVYPHLLSCTCLLHLITALVYVFASPRAKIHWEESKIAASEKGAVSRFTVSPFARYYCLRVYLGSISSFRMDSGWNHPHHFDLLLFFVPCCLGAIFLRRRSRAEPLQSAYHDPHLDVTEWKQNRTT